ncbi:helix-turn-helix domain-containing protein [Lactococcus lactis]|jgi:Plasmid maintenance system antidote protein|uniref:Transcriptional regulator n=1 Tax=Lactococcus lactis subsp. hordniae TaxID=203404 RepID=A0A2A5SJN2_LACLH|nr:helix-turn-helix transcriptional regulator [Lactococcus lactis]KAA8705043.1 helix-turn-helix transcriptional regulator [Lactococcus lactis subsp. hordniae]MCT3134271.1 XRE family transcriptional regulator [Lactococcus lactis]PCS13681.1 transcriptional regulator [Lactococcus lactis subsp. hordniae]
MTEKSIFYTRLEELVRLSGKSNNQIERELGYPRNALNNYKGRGEPSATRLLELANYFEVPPEFLIGKNSDVDIKSIRGIFERLNSKQKRELFEISLDWVISFKKNKAK